MNERRKKMLVLGIMVSAILFLFAAFLPRAIVKPIPEISGMTLIFSSPAAKK